MEGAVKAKGLKKLAKRAKPMGPIHAYMLRNEEFAAMLKERTPGEVAYDNAITAGMRKGLTIEDALKVAAEKYPEEALQWDETTVQEVRAIRDEYARRFDYDLDAIFEDLKYREAQLHDRLVTLPPRPAELPEKRRAAS